MLTKPYHSVVPVCWCGVPWKGHKRCYRCTVLLHGDSCDCDVQKEYITEHVSEEKTEELREAIPNYIDVHVKVSDVHLCTCGRKYIKTRGEEQKQCLFCINNVKTWQGS